MFPSGDPTISCDEAVMSQQGDGCGRGTTWPVGSKPEGKSPHEVLDMAGNVAEWVADWYDPTAYASAPEVNPGGPPEGQLRVVRGGSWRDPLARQLRTSSRDKQPPGMHSIVIGFRCARSVAD
jgi:formylglycine-generating enzyme required for sulfatase activity